MNVKTHRYSFFDPFKKLNNLANKPVQLERSEDLLRVIEDWEIVKNNTTLLDFDISTKLVSEKLRKLITEHKPAVTKKIKKKDFIKFSTKVHPTISIKNKSENEKKSIPENKIYPSKSKKLDNNNQKQSTQKKSLSFNFPDNLTRLSERHKNSLSKLITNKIDEAVETRKKYLKIKKKLFPSISQPALNVKESKKESNSDESNLHNWIINNNYMKYMRTFYNAKSKPDLLNSMTKLCRDVYNIKAPINMEAFQQIIEAQNQLKNTKLKPSKTTPNLKKSLLKDFEKKKEIKEDNLKKKIEEIKKMFKLDEDIEADEISEEEEEKYSNKQGDFPSLNKDKTDRLTKTHYTYSFKRTCNSFLTNHTRINLNKNMSLTSIKRKINHSIQPQFFESCDNNFRNTKSLFITNSKIVNKGNEAINVAYVKAYAPSQQRIYQDPVILSLAQDTMIDFRRKGGFIYGNSKGFYLKTNEMYS